MSNKSYLKVIPRHTGQPNIWIS